MMRRWIVGGLFLLLVLLGVAGWRLVRPPMVEYVAVVMDGKRHLVADPTMATPAHLNRLERVLDTYGETHVRVSPTKLLIPRKLASDTELLWNYTTKASDQHWLGSSR